jgi:hypothetical protein
MRKRRVGAVLAAVACFTALVLGSTAWQPMNEAAAQDDAKPKFTPTQARALEEWSHALALDAATYGSPAVIMYLLRYNDAVGPKPLAPPNHLWRMENITTPELALKEGYVLPNCSTIYGFGFLDLRAEPVILTLPNSDGRYYMVECVDMWTNAFAYPAGVVAGYDGGKYAMVGPGWKGKLPDGVKRIDCPTPWILIQPRVHLPDPSQITAARKVLAGIIPKGLAEFIGQPAPAASTIKYLTPHRKNPKLPVSAMDFDDPLQFWEILSAAMNENPPPASQVKALLPMYKALGIELGKQWDRSRVDPIVLKAMARAAETIPTMLTELPFGRLTNGWFIPPPTIGDPKTDYKIRAVVARVGLTANTPREAVYFEGKMDADGQPLTGAKNYTITFPKGQTPPYHKPAFWALRMFDGKNSYPVPNPIDRYVIGSDTQGMKHNEDGSLTIYVQPDSPGKDKESNWLPGPRGPMIVILAPYAPGEAIIELLSNPKAYVPPPFVAAK